MLEFRLSPPQNPKKAANASTPTFWNWARIAWILFTDVSFFRGAQFFSRAAPLWLPSPTMGAAPRIPETRHTATRPNALCRSERLICWP